MKLFELSSEQIRLVKDGESLSQLLPIKFASGFTLTHFGVRCAKCQKEQSPEHVQAEIAFPIATVANIEAIGFCHECQLLTVTKKRIRSDERGTQVEGLDNEGKWVRQELTPRRNLWTRLKALIQKL